MSDVSGTDGQLPPAQWFPDPHDPNSGRQRYWNGHAWTGHYHPPLPDSASTANLSRRERKALEKAEAQRLAARHELETTKAELIEMIDYATDFEGGGPADALDAGIVLKRGERAYGIFHGASLVEIKAGRGHFQAGTAGFRFRVTNRTSVSVGGARGSYVPGEETMTVVDQGTLAFTDARAVFNGPSQTREWQYSKLTGIRHDDDGNWTALAVSNRQKTSGFAYNAEFRDSIRFRLALGLAAYQDARQDLIDDLRTQLAEVEAQLSST